MLLEVLNYFLGDNSAFYVHVLNLFVLITLIVLFISARKAGKKWTKVNDYFGILTKTVNSIRYGDLTKKMDLPNSGPLAESLNRMIETLYDREKMIVEYQNELHRQNKFLEAVINSLSDGLIVIDENYKILRATPKISEWFNVEGKKLLNTPLTDYIELQNRSKIETLKNVQTIADGIAVKTPGTNTFELIKKYVDGIYTVSDDEIALAILTLMEQQKLVSEGAGAVPVAAVMNGKIPDIEGKKVCCLVSGGNIDVTILSRVIERGLKMGGRSASITIALSDKPGQLLGVSKIVADNGANVVSVNYDSTDLDMNITDCYLKLGIETRNYQHIVQIKNALKDAGFEVCD